MTEVDNDHLEELRQQVKMDQKRRLRLLTSRDKHTTGWATFKLEEIGADLARLPESELGTVSRLHRKLVTTLAKYAARKAGLAGGEIEGAINLGRKMYERKKEYSKLTSKSLLQIAMEGMTRLKR